MCALKRHLKMKVPHEYREFSNAWKELLIMANWGFFERAKPTQYLKININVLKKENHIILSMDTGKAFDKKNSTSTHTKSLRKIEMEGTVSAW